MAVEGGDAGVDAGFRLDESGVGKPSECLPDGRPAEAEALGDIAVPDLFPGSKFAADDRVFEPLVGRVAHARPVDRRFIPP